MAERCSGQLTPAPRSIILISRRLLGHLFYDVIRHYIYDAFADMAEADAAILKINSYETSMA